MLAVPTPAGGAVAPALGDLKPAELPLAVFTARPDDDGIDRPVHTRPDDPPAVADAASLGEGPPSAQVRAHGGRPYDSWQRSPRRYAVGLGLAPGAPRSGWVAVEQGRRPGQRRP